MYIKRDIEKKLEQYINLEEIVAVIGPRQAGKTTLINNYLDTLQTQKVSKGLGIVSEKNSLKLKIKKISFDDINSLELFENDIENFIKKNVIGFDILFIDEIQYSKTSGKKLKYIYDSFSTKKKIKIIISGSSASEISLHSLKYLVGRIFILELFTLSFNEFLRFKNEKIFEIYKSKKYENQIQNEINDYILEYVKYGGYPRVVLTEDKKLKEDVLNNIYNTYLLREINELFNFKDNLKLNSLIKILSLQIGNIINYNDLSAKTNLKINELKEIFYILEKTYILNTIKPFFRNKTKEFVKSPKIFFFDLGFRNIAIKNFDIESSSNIGFIYENFIYGELLRNNLEIKYWRTKSKAEVDFVIEKSSKIISIEVKTIINSDIIGKGYISFLNDYKPNYSYYLSLNYINKRKINNLKINFLTYSKFIREITNW